MERLLYSTDMYFRNLGAEWADMHYIACDIFVTSKCFKVSAEDANRGEEREQPDKTLRDHRRKVLLLSLLPR